MEKNISLGESMTTTSKKIKIECSETPTVNIPSKIFSDLYYLHSKYQGKEWSGHLYYTKQGDIIDPANLIIDVKEFTLLDLGTAGATEIDPTGEQIIDMYEKKPQLLTMKHGLIHTHHNMRTFFSGTDWDTLLENAQHYNFFLSVIVNNAGDTIAKISLQGFIEESATQHTHKYRFNKGFVEKIIEVENKITEIIYVYTCKVNIENFVDEELDKLLAAQLIKQLTPYSYTGTNTYKSFIDDWSDEVKLNPRHPNFKVKAHKKVNNNSEQTRMFELNPTTKELTKTFLICLILQDGDDMINTFNFNYAQAIASWNEEVGEELIKEYSAYVEGSIEDIFYNIYGEETLIEMPKQTLIDIRANVNIILGTSLVELTLKDIINEFLNTIK